MSLATCQNNLLKLLGDKNNQVIALSGRWGTGKTYLWEQVKAKSADEKVRTALYASVFSANSISELKVKLARSRFAPEEESKWEVATKLYGKFIDLVKKEHGAFATLDALALLAVPGILSDRFIVIDDIERMPSKLSVDELMGFIDEFTKHHSCRFLLILNEDQIKRAEDKRTWETLREKVIDRELKLNTTAAEAVEVALLEARTSHPDAVKSAVIALGLTNIRVIRKAVRVLNSLLIEHADVNASVLHRIIPSTILMSAIHFKGLTDGPTMEFVLAFGTPHGRELRALLTKQQGTEKTAEEKQITQWSHLLRSMGIHSVDEFEPLLSNYLKTGQIEDSAVAELLHKYVSQSNVAKASDAADDLMQLIWWRPDVSVAEIVDQASKFASHAGFINFNRLSSICKEVRLLPGGDAAAEKIVDGWIASFKVQEYDDIVSWRPNPTKVEPRIVAAIQAAQARSVQPRSLLAVTRHIVERSGWGETEESILKSSTPEEFQAALSTLVGADLELFLQKHIELYQNAASHDNHFGQAMEHFVEACRRLCADAGTNPRLIFIIRGIFEARGMSSLLDTNLHGN